jgi:hypothetical protein
MRKGEGGCDEDGTITTGIMSLIICGCSPSLPNAGLQRLDKLREGHSACLCAEVDASA